MSFPRPIVAFASSLLTLAILLLPAARSAAEEMIDMTLLFHSAVQGKIEPCG